MSRWAKEVCIHLIDPARVASAIVSGAILVIGFMVISRINAVHIEKSVRGEMWDTHQQLDTLSKNYVPRAEHEKKWADEAERFEAIEKRQSERR